MANTLAKVEKAFFKFFEPPQVDGYIILTDYYAFTNTNYNCCYPIVIKIKEPDKAVHNIPAHFSSVPFSSQVKTLSASSYRIKRSSPVTFSSKTHSPK